MTNEQLDALVKDARLAAQCLQDTGSFEIGQAILREAADAIAALRARAEAAEADAERLAEALEDIADGMGETDQSEIGRFAPAVARAALAAHNERIGK